MPVGTEKKLKQHGDTRPAAGLSSPRGPLTLIQRKCRCGESAGPTNKCPDCRTRQLLGKSDRLDARWALSQPGDALEREAERMARQALQNPESAARLGYRPCVRLTPVQRLASDPAQATCHRWSGTFWAGLASRWMVGSAEPLRRVSAMTSDR